MYEGDQNIGEEAEAEALIEHPNYYQEEERNLNRNEKGFIETILDFTLYPIGRGIAYLIPNFLMKIM